MEPNRYKVLDVLLADLETQLNSPELQGWEPIALSISRRFVEPEEPAGPGMAYTREPDTDFAVVILRRHE